MFNRELKVDIVKKAKENGMTYEEDTPPFEVKAVFVARLVDDGIQKVATAVFAYVVLDTIRQAIVASIKEKK